MTKVVHRAQVGFVIVVACSRVMLLQLVLWLGAWVEA